MRFNQRGCRIADPLSSTPGLNDRIEFSQWINFRFDESASLFD